MAPWDMARLEHQIVQRFGTDTRLDMFDEHVEGFGWTARFRHTGEGFWTVELDSVVARLGAGDFEIGHGYGL